MNSRYILFRFIRLIITLYIVATIVFFMLKLAPGTPLAHYINPFFTEKHADLLIRQFGLDKPLHIQYFKYMASISTLNFGTSFRYKQPVISLIANRIPNTLLLLLPTLLLTYSIGLIWGMTAGWKRGSRFEYTSLVITLTGRAAPTFWVGMMVITLFSFKLGLFPSGGMTSPGYYFDSFYKMLFSPNVLWHMILPVTTYAFYLIGLPFLVMRTGMLENINKDYTIMHRYCGLSDTKVMTRAARNSLLPVITVIALGIGHIFEGSPVVEAVFGWPGIGLLLVDGVTSSDYPLAQACFLMLAASVLIMNFMADILYGLLDPRIKTERGL